MFPEQGVCGLGVFKALIQRGSGYPFPAAGVVAGLAGLLREAAFVRVAVAIRAFAERQSRETRLLIGAGCVALLTFDLGMQAGKRVAGFRVIKLPGSIFPVRAVVTLRTIRPEAALVCILVTCRTTTA